MTRACRKLTNKRDTLAATARLLVTSGIEFQEADLPRSFRPEGWEEPARVAEGTSSVTTSVTVTTSGPAEPSSAFGEEIARLQMQAVREQESPLASALGSWKDDLAAYKKRRQKTAVAAA